MFRQVGWQTGLDTDRQEQTRPFQNRGQEIVSRCVKYQAIFVKCTVYERDKYIIFIIIKWVTFWQVRCHSCINVAGQQYLSSKKEYFTCETWLFADLRKDDPWKGLYIFYYFPRCWTLVSVPLTSFLSFNTLILSLKNLGTSSLFRIFTKY